MTSKDLPDTPGQTAKSTVERIHGQLHSVHTILDQKGKEIHRAVKPMMVEMRFGDVAQLVVGACVLAIPVAFTEEVWLLGQRLPAMNVVGIAITSIVFLSFFAYFIFYQDHLGGHAWDFFKRVAAAYVITFTVAAILLTLFDKCPWSTDPATALKRVVLVTFPACFSATVVDSLK